MKIIDFINTLHPAYLEHIREKRTLSASEALKDSQCSPLFSEDWEVFDNNPNLKLHVFGNPEEAFTNTPVYELDGKFFSYVNSGFGGDIEEFNNINTALMASFVGYYPEGDTGCEWDEDNKEWIKDGKWLIRCANSPKAND